MRLNEKLELRLVERTAQVQQKTRQLRAMAKQLTQVERRERRRLAGILHSHIQQLLLSARVQMSLVNRDDLAVAERNALSRADEIMGQAMGDCRSLAVDLSPPILHEAGLGAALEWLAQRMLRQHRFTVNLHIDSCAEPRSTDLRACIFEAMHELLLNAFKHSGCTSARVKMTREPNHWLRITIEDAGKGFDPGAPSTRKSGGERFGLSSIQQRLGQLGGRMKLESSPGAGTRVEILARTARRHLGDRDSERRTATGTAAGQDDATEGALRIPGSDNYRPNPRLTAEPVSLRAVAC
jgi:signal transduction histidine kinase